MLNLITRKILGIGDNPAVDANWTVWNWNYHEIPWLASIGAGQAIYDGCLQVDKDTTDADTVAQPVSAVTRACSRPACRVRPRRLAQGM